MKRIALIFSVLSIWIALSGSYYVCVIKGLCDNIVEEPELEVSNSSAVIVEANSVASLDTQTTNIEPENKSTIVDTLYTYPLEIYSGSTLLTNYEVNFSIKRNDTTVIIPEALESFNTIIKSNIQDFDTAMISVYSYYDVEEDTTIAIGRANYIKEALKQVAVSDEKITIQTEQINIGFDTEDLFQGGLEINIDFVEGITNEELTYESDEFEESYDTNEEITAQKKPYVSQVTQEENIEVNKTNYRPEATLVTPQKVVVNTITKKVNKAKKNLVPKVKLQKNKPAETVKAIETVAIVEKENIPVVKNPPEVAEVKAKLEGNPVITAVIKSDKKQVQPKNKVVEPYLKNTTITQIAFKGTKLKDTKIAKSFIADYKNGQTIYLTGFSNEKKSSFDNYQSGLALANSVKGYLKKQGVSSSNIIVNSKKLSQGEIIKRGVLLQLK